MTRILKYPLDLTGENPNNLVEDEIHRMGAAKRRAFVMNYGPFFVESLVVKTVQGVVLEPRKDYLVLHPHQPAAMKTGKDVCSVIYIHNRAIEHDVMFTAQMIGGEMNWSAAVLQDLLDQILIDDRPVHWGDIIDKPNMFNPAPHLHDIGDTYGWEYIGYQLEQLRIAILQGDEGSHEDIYAKLRLLAEMVAANENVLKRHVRDKDNPHGTTKTHVGLGKVVDQAQATLEQILAAASVETDDPLVKTNEYVSLEGLNVALRKYHSEQVGPHINDRDNPHGVSKEQVGLKNVQDFPMAEREHAIAGTSQEHYMSPAATLAMIKKFAAAPDVTASTLGVYTKDEIDRLLEGYLKKDGVLDIANGGTGVDTLPKLKKLILGDFNPENLGNSATRDFFVSTTTPDNSKGKVGDIWLQYKP